MVLIDLTLVGYALAAFVGYKIFWSFFGERILIALYPQHYAVWAGTEEPPQTGWLGQLQFLLKVRKVASGELDLLDDIIFAGFKRDGNTVKRKGVIGLHTIEPQNIQAMLATQFKDFGIGSLRKGALGPILGDSIFTSDGAFWEHSRALFRPQFSRDNINDLAATGSAADALIAACGYTDADGWTGKVDLSPLFYNFTLDTATDFLFGESLNSQNVAVKQARGEYIAPGEQDVSTSEQFLESLDVINAGVMSRMRFGHFYWLYSPARFQKAIKFIKEWTESWAQLALKAPHAEKAEGKKTNVLSTLATQCKDANELRNQTLAILFAGRDTTASLLGFMFMRLALNPDIYQKLRKIVLADFPIGSEITFGGLKSCRYLQHIINEALRLHPTVPLNFRVALRDTTLPVGGGADGKSPIAVRKGQMVGFIVYALHRRKDLWGEDAEEFKPERWEQRVPAWQFLPFLGGARICLGQQFAITEASFMLVKMCQQFDKIEPVDRPQMAQMRKKLGVTLSVKDGVPVRLHKAT